MYKIFPAFISGTNRISGSPATSPLIPFLLAAAIEIRIDKKDAPLLGRLEVNSTGDYQNWEEQTCKLNKTKEIHDLYLVFKGYKNDMFNID